MTNLLINLWQTQGSCFSFKSSKGADFFIFLTNVTGGLPLVSIYVNEFVSIGYNIVGLVRGNDLKFNYLIKANRCKMRLQGYKSSYIKILTILLYVQIIVFLKTDLRRHDRKF